jgi:SAM-dependent methyltransferase
MRSCPICRNSQHLVLRGTLPVTTVPKYSHERFDYVECPKCSAIYISPLPTADDFRAMYAKTSELFVTPTYRDKNRVEMVEKYFANRLQAILTRARRDVSSEIRVLEIGAGLAWMCRAAKQLNSTSLTHAQDVGDAIPEGCVGVDEYYFGDLKDMRFKSQESYDVISLTHVIEHLPDPVRDLTQLGGLLAPSGIVFVTAPHRPINWTADSDFVSAWKSYSLNHVPAHLTYFAKSTMIAAASRSNLNLIFWQVGARSGAYESWLSRFAVDQPGMSPQ